MAAEQRPENSRRGTNGNRGLELSARARHLRIRSSAVAVVSRAADAWRWRPPVRAFRFAKALDRTACSASCATEISAALATAARFRGCARAHDWPLTHVMRH